MGVAEKATEEALAELQSLIGLSAVKDEVVQLVDFIKVQGLRRDAGMAVPEISKHLVFVGNPGTGKTTVARIVANVYNAVGVCRLPNLIETDRAGLVGEYIGHTALKTKAKIAEALGGVLFIDEAYSLTPDTDFGNDFGSEAIDALLKEMEDHRDDLVVIVAGYPDEMERFVKSNPGLESRFSRVVRFADYSAAEMMKIFLRLCERHDYQLSRQAEEILEAHFDGLCKVRSKGFANGREVRNIFERAVRSHSSRIARFEGRHTDYDLTHLYLDDIARAIGATDFFDAMDSEEQERRLQAEESARKEREREERENLVREAQADEAERQERERALREAEERRLRAKAEESNRKKQERTAQAEQAARLQEREEIERKAQAEKAARLQEREEIERKAQAEKAARQQQERQEQKRKAQGVPSIRKSETDLVVEERKKIFLPKRNWNPLQRNWDFSHKDDERVSVAEKNLLILVGVAILISLFAVAAHFGGIWGMAIFLALVLVAGVGWALRKSR